MMVIVGLVDQLIKSRRRGCNGNESINLSGDMWTNSSTAQLIKCILLAKPSEIHVQLKEIRGIHSRLKRPFEKKFEIFCRSLFPFEKSTQTDFNFDRVEFQTISKAAELEFTTEFGNCNDHLSIRLIR